MVEHLPSVHKAPGLVLGQGLWGGCELSNFCVYLKTQKHFLYNNNEENIPVDLQGNDFSVELGKKKKIVIKFNFGLILHTNTLFVISNCVKV